MPPLPFPVPKVRLRTTLVVPFVLQIVAAVGLVGYLSFRNGQAAVADLATQLSKQASDRVSQQLNTYLSIPRQANAINLQAIDLGMLDTQDSDTMRRFFWKQMKVFPNLSYMNFGSENGRFIGVGRENNGTLYVEVIQPPNREGYRRYALDSQGNPTQFLEAAEYNFQEDVWYRSAAQTRKPMWSPIYQWPDRPEVISISSNYPVFDESQRLIGVLGVDFILSQLSDFLRGLNISPSGKIFVVEPDGNVIASSGAEKISQHSNGSIQRLNIVNSQDPVIRDLARQLRDRVGGFHNITQSQLTRLTANQTAVFVSVTPWQDELGLKWIVIVAIPEADFMNRINANTRNAILLCGAAFLGALALGILTSNWVTRPILRISRASSAVAAGDIDQTVPPSALIEIDRLATSFNQMAAGLKQSFSALRQSEARNQAILNAIPDQILQVQQDGRYLDIKPAQQRSLAFHRQLGTTIYEILPPNVVTAYLQHIDHALQTGEIQAFEYELTDSDMAGFYEARVVRSDVDEVLVMIRNISDRKRNEAKQRQAEANLLESEARFRTLVANIPGAIYRCQQDSNWTMNYLSDAIASIVGYPASDFINNQVRSFSSIIHPDDLDLVEIVIGQAVKSHDPFTLAYRVLHQDGSVRWVHEQGRGIFDADHQFLYIDGAIFDITERKQAERSLRHSEATNRALVQAIPDLLLRVSRAGVYLSNPIGMNRLLQVSGDNPNLIGTRVEDSLPPDLATARMNAIAAALSTGELQVYEQRLVIHEQVIHEEVRVAVMSDDEVLIIVRDISARKQAEEALRLANEELEQRVERRTSELRQEKERSEQLLLNILPAEIAERLKQDDASPAEHFEEATILFADIVGFTSLAANLEPMQLVDGLNQIFSFFDQLTEKHGLEKIKTIGDAYMVVGGLPLPRADHAAAIAEIALDMQAHMREVDSSLGDSLQLRIGINTGSVIAGVIGIKKFIYDLWGDAVNIASRMESQGEPGQIQVSESTYEQLQHQFRFQPRGKISVKGRGEMMTYWLLGRH